MAASASSNSPIPSSRLDTLAKEACNSTFQFVDSYQHARCESWNTNIINTILQSLIAESSLEGKPPQYKYAVTSTIIQHVSPPRQTMPPPSESMGVSMGNNDGGLSETKGEGVAGRRGMHSATGAYWNNEKDGMWSYKYEGEAKGFDVIVSVVWISMS